MRQRAEVRGQMTEVRVKKTDDRNQLRTGFRFLIPAPLSVACASLVEDKDIGYANVGSATVPTLLSSVTFFTNL